MSTLIYLGDKLPTIYDAAVCIYSLACTPGTTKRNEVINEYAASLRSMWIKSFGEEHTKPRKTVITQLELIMRSYNTKVRGQARYGDSRSKNKVKVKSIRHLNKEWRNEMIKSKGKRGRKSDLDGRCNNDLFDIGHSMDKVEGREKVFYLDQCSSRECRLSEELDIDFEQQQQEILEEQEELESFINPPEYQEVITPSTSTSRNTDRFSSTPIQIPHMQLHDQEETSVAIQLFDHDHSKRPEIRNTRNFDSSIKDAIATVSYRAAISIPKARVAVQATCEKFYSHQYYLTPDEQKKIEPLEVIEEEETDIATNKNDNSIDTSSEPPIKKARSKDSYIKNYKYVLPSRRVVADFKHQKAMQQEIAAAKALCNKSAETKVTLHFDTTSRSRVDGEWPSIILNFKSDIADENQMFLLRALFFAYEDREQITKLVLETLSRLHVACNGEKSSKELWELIYAFMTDSVTKNLKVEELVAQRLGSSHIPKHILCKSHTCEKLDECCINALCEIESQLKISDMMIQRQPRLKSFIRQSRCVAVCAMTALLKLVAHEQSAKPTSLAKDFELILEEDGISKKFSLYKERRFTKLGYTAGAIVDCIPQFEKLLNNTSYNNMLVQACRLYLECDYVISALKALANFTYHVTMPFLNCIEKTDQNDLVKILPQLYDDLSNCKLDTLKEYHVKWIHVQMDKQQSNTDFDDHLLKKMCLNAAEGVKMQCAREYWGDGREARATELYKMTPEERKNLPSENLACERYLAKFGYLASISAARSNKYFKAKRIRDDLMFDSDKKEKDIEKSSLKIIKTLKLMEVTWTKQQGAAFKNRIKEKIKKKERSNAYGDVILKRCKQHGGPIVTLTELQNFVKNTSKEDLKQQLRNEIILQRVMHPVDSKERSHLYKVNQIEADQLLENLTILLESPDESEKEDQIEFPSVYQMMVTIQNKSEENASTNQTWKFQQPLAVVWDQQDGNRKWFIGFFLGENEDMLRVDHLIGSSSEWKRPVPDDIQNETRRQQIVPCNVIGDWVFDRRHPIFKVENVAKIDEIFREYFA